MAHLRPKTFSLPQGDFDFKSRRKLGGGCFGTAYAVKYRGEEVAIKVPFDAESTEDEKEIINLSRVAHKNIVCFIGTVQYEERTCLVLELASLGSVRGLIKKGNKLSLLRASRAKWLIDIARGLRYLHSEATIKLVHGDLKGDNILLFEDPKEKTLAKIADFGLSRALTITRSVDHPGTPLFSAPEILAHECHSQRSDCWSFGCVAIELFTEQFPYVHLRKGDLKNPHELLRQVKDRELDPLVELKVTWPEGFEDVVRRCCKRHHKDRPTMEEVFRDLTADALPSRTEKATQAPMNTAPPCDRSVMARPISDVRFEIIDMKGDASYWIIESSPADALPDVLKKLSEKANISAENLSFVYRAELGKVENGRLRYFKMNAERICNEKGEVEWERVFANHGSSEKSGNIFPKGISIARNHITELDDVVCSPGLVPVISIDLRAAFFDLDSSAAFNLIPRSVEALSDPQCVGWIQCIRITDARGQLPSKLLLFDKGYVDVNSGAVFESRQQAIEASSIPTQNWREERCYILLRHGCKLPKWPLRPDMTVGIAIRDGCDFLIRDGRIQMKETATRALPSRWIFPKWKPGLPIPSDSKPHSLAQQILQFIGS